MKKKYFLLLLFLSLFFLSSCHRFLLKHAGGLRPYKVENKQSIITSLSLYPPLAEKHYLTKPMKLKVLEKYNSMDSAQYRQQDKQIVAADIKKELEYSFPLKISFDSVLTDKSGILIFDAEGKMIKYQEDTKCSGKADDFIKQLSKQGRFPKTDTIVLPYYLNKITDIDRKSVTMKELGQNDFYFLMVWTNWFGMSKKHAKSWIKQLQKYKDIRIKVLLVNSDMMNDWDLADKMNFDNAKVR